MQHQPEGGFNFWGSGFFILLFFNPVAFAIYRVPNNRMANGGKMKTNLVGPSGF